MLHRVPNKLVLFGSGFIVLGSALLLWTLGYLPAAAALWPVIVMLAGLWMLHAVFFRGGRESYVFSGLFLALGGAVVLLMNTVLSRVALTRIWPVFMAIAGFSLLGYGLKKHEPSARAVLIVPAWAIILLALIFLPFSLDVVSISFIRFVGLWWPVLFIAAGVVMLIAHIRRRPRG